MRAAVRWGPVVLAVGLLAALLWAEWAVLGERTSLALFALLNVILFVDFVDVLVRLPLRHIAGPPTPGGGSADPGAADRGDAEAAGPRPYAIIASIFNVEGEIETLLATLAPFKDVVWFVDDASEDGTVGALRSRGWRCVPVTPNRKKPGALRLLLPRLPAEVETILVIDPDIDFRHLDGPVAGLERCVAAFQASGSAARSPRLRVGGSGWLARFQRLEYCLTFELTRQSLRGVCATSGIALYRREALEGALAAHSLSVYAEDLENALRLLASGERVEYDRSLVVWTEAPGRWRSWFSQRVGWSFGLIRAYHLCGPALRRFRWLSVASYQYRLYLGVFCLLLHPLKVLSAVALVASLGFSVVAPWVDPAYAETARVLQVSAAGVYLRYTLLVALTWLFIVPRDQKWSLLAVVPTYLFYVVALLVPTSLGFGNWYSLRHAGRRLYRDHYQGDRALRDEFYRPALPAPQ